jgi:hypothetical protein
VQIGKFESHVVDPVGLLAVDEFLDVVSHPVPQSLPALKSRPVSKNLVGSAPMTSSRCGATALEPSPGFLERDPIKPIGLTGESRSTLLKKSTIHRSG